tara:strand:- start:48 stop:482 length:435 start_codon:yes stop_codon:yes gene_type:complete
MSVILNKVLIGDTGGIQVDTSTPTGSAYRAGSRLASDGKLYVTTTGPATHFIGGIGHLDSGAVLISQNPIVAYAAGIPLDSGGAIVYTDVVGSGDFVAGILVRDAGVFMEGVTTLEGLNVDVGAGFVALQVDEGTGFENLQVTQ